MFLFKCPALQPSAGRVNEAVFIRSTDVSMPLRPPPLKRVVASGQTLVIIQIPASAIVMFGSL